jgi:V/A-type H+-transporting ATPase subunit C
LSHRKDTDYLAISTRIHAMETRMLTRERMERMIDAKDNSEAIKVLEECGYGEVSTAGGLEGMLSAARGAVFQDIRTAVPDGSLVEVFQLKYDYHNAKTLVKAQAVGTDPGRLLLAGGRYDPRELREGWERDDLRGCSDTFRAAMAQAKETLADTSDPQLADLVLDRACYQEMGALAKQSGSEFLQGYVRLTIDVANLRTAVRCARLDKDSEFVSRVLLPGGNVSTRAIAAAKGEGLKDLFQAGLLSQAAALGSRLAQPGAGPLTEFEGMCDDAVTAYLSAAKRVPFGEQTVVGYLYAKESELTSVRTIMSGRMAGLDGEVIRSRLRAAYV